MAEILDNLVTNVETFQIWLDGTDEPRAVPGIAVQANGKGELFIDPQDEIDNPESFGPAKIEHLKLKINKQNTPPVVNGRIHLASMVLRTLRMEEELLQGEVIDAPVSDPGGQLALVGIVERPGFEIARINQGWGNHTKRLQAFETDNGYLVSLLSLSLGGAIRIMCGEVRSKRYYDITYNRVKELDIVEHKVDKNDVDKNDKDEDRGNDEPGSGDRNPRNPVAPTDSEAVALEPPTPNQEPLVLQGKIP